MTRYDLKSIRALSSELTKGVLNEIDPAAVEHLDRVERSVFEAAYGLPPDLEFAAALLQAIARALTEIPERTILSAKAPEEVAETIVKETLARIAKRGEELGLEKVGAGFESFFGRSPSILDWILGFFLLPFKARGDELNPLDCLERGVLKIIDHQGRISTGFALCDKGHVLTAEHVAQGHVKIKVAFRYPADDGKKKELVCWAEVIHSDQDRDIAILQMSPRDWEALRRVDLVPLSLSLGWQPRDWVLCLGYQEQEIFADPISVEAFIKPHDPIRAVRFRDGHEQECLVLVIPRDHPTVVPGMSGGPVLDLNTGKVIAMVTGATREAWVRQRWRNQDVWELISSALYSFATPLHDVAESWPEFEQCCLAKD